MIVSDHERFTDGDCWVLARRLHRLTGWRMCSFYCPNDSEPDMRFTGHAFCVRPDGKAVDVEGVCSQREMANRYHFYKRDIVTITLRQTSCLDLVLGRHSYARARIVAKQLVDKHGES